MFTSFFTSVFMNSDSEGIQFFGAALSCGMSFIYFILGLAISIFAYAGIMRLIENEQMKDAFNWFLGENHLHQIIYNPCTGGCYDGLEEHNVNLNQGAESTVSYLMARLTLESA